MSLSELLPAIRALTEADQVQLVQLLVEELPPGSLRGLGSADLIATPVTAALLSPIPAPAAAAALLSLLAKEL